MPSILTLQVQGGYNGGATITISVDGTNVFTSTASDTYNRNYDVLNGTISFAGSTINVTVTPPQSNTGALVIDFTGGFEKQFSIKPKGANTSYGYDFITYMQDGEATLPANFIKVKFTDGTFVTIYNTDSPTILPLNYTLAVPNFIFRLGGMSFTKTDLDGNEWSFDGATLSIGGNTAFTLTSDRYNTAYLSASYSNLNKVYTSLYATPVYSLSDTTVKIAVINGTSDYIDIAEAIKLVDIQYNKGYTALANNIIAKQELPYSLAIFGGVASTSAKANSLIVTSSTGSSTTVNITLSNDTAEVFPIGPDGEVVPGKDNDPYEKGGSSDTGGGQGDFDNTSEDVPIPDLPSLSSVINTGFISLFDGTVTELNSLATYLWSPDGLDLETFKKVFSDPISAILGLSIFPIPPDVSLEEQVILGNMATGVYMRRITNQYKRFDCGTLNINEYWGGYLDYSPYTSIEIFLPYIGTRTLNTDDVMGKSIHLVYHIDFLSGACCAILEVDGTVLYQFMGQCSCSVPVTGRDMTNLINGVLSVVGAGVGSLVATGGNFALAGATAIGSLASSVTSAKPKVEKTGAMGSMGGMLGVRTPYITITRPNQALPAAQNRYTGYPSYISLRIGELSGYTVMSEVHLKDMPATEEEKIEIERLLKGGVII